ncbi:MAG: glycosyltransferase [Chloroflexia bacterium]|nr:glycosyltransferase [Chloroflexia bacterium]
MQILMLGVKEFPYGISAKYEKFPGGGTARYVISISKHLADNGFVVHLIVRKMPGQKLYESIGNLKIHRVFWINNKYLRWPSFSIASFLRSFSIINKIDLIHSHGSFDAIFGIILSRLFKKKIIGTPHGLTSFQAEGRYNKITVRLTASLERMSFRKLDKIIFLTNAERDVVFEKLNMNHLNYEIVNMAIEPIQVNRTQSTLFKIVFIGRLVPIKGLENLLCALKQIPENILKSIKLFIVGDGFIRTELEQFSKDHKLDEFVHFEGFTTNIEQYLNDASLYILPSTGGEGLPVSMLEAMSAGVPCMVSNFEAPFSENTFISLSNNNLKQLQNQLFITLKILQNYKVLVKKGNWKSKINFQ